MVGAHGTRRWAKRNRPASVVSARWLVARASSREARRASAATTDEAYQTHAALRAAAAGAREARARPLQARIDARSKAISRTSHLGCPRSPAGASVGGGVSGGGEPPPPKKPS